jgi:hypothetical protein
MGDANTSAVAIAAYAVLLVYLRRAMDRGDMTAQEMSTLLDESLTPLETLGSAPMIDGARRLLEESFRVYLAPSQPVSPVPQPRPARRPKHRKS